MRTTAAETSRSSCACLSAGLSFSPLLLGTLHTQRTSQLNAVCSSLITKTEPEMAQAITNEASRQQSLRLDACNCTCSIPSLVAAPDANTL